MKGCEIMKTGLNPNSLGNSPILRRVGKIVAGTSLIIGSCLFGTALGKGIGHSIKYADDKIDECKDQIEVYQETKKEGLPYYSYGQAKATLDSIDLDRNCKNLGVEVPKKPAANASHVEKLEYNTKIKNIYDQSINCEFDKIISTLNQTKAQKTYKN